MPIFRSHYLKVITLLFALQFLNNFLFAQLQSDTTMKLMDKPKPDQMMYQGSLWSKEKFSYAGKDNYKYGEAKGVLLKAKQNEQLIANADIAKAFTFIFAAGGGFCIGWAMGGALSGKPLNLPLLGVGAGLIIVSIPISIGYSNSMKKAVKNFNDRE